MNSAILTTTKQQQQQQQQQQTEQIWLNEQECFRKNTFV